MIKEEEENIIKQEIRCFNKKSRGVAKQLSDLQTSDDAVMHSELEFLAFPGVDELLQVNGHLHRCQNKAGGTQVP
jgi:hypothetical protein